MARKRWQDNRVPPRGDNREGAYVDYPLEQLNCHNIYMYACWTFQFPEPELLAFKNVIGPAFGPRQYAPWQTMAL